MKNKTFTITDTILATLGQRILNLLLDFLFIYIIILSVATSIVLIADVGNAFSVSDWVETLSWNAILGYGLLIVFMYYFLTEVYFARTLAKLVTRTIVVKNDGTKPSIQMIFIRTVCRFLPLEGLTFLGSIPWGWHDRFSGTYVVQKKKLAKSMHYFQHPEEFGKAE